jgi:hypothetical protein
MYLIGRSEDVLVPTAAGLGAESTRREETKDQMATVYEGLGRGNVTRAGRQQSEPVFFRDANSYTRADIYARGEDRWQVPKDGKLG